MRFDRKRFFDKYRERFGSLSQQQVKGLERLLTGIENDPHIPEPPIGIYYAAYMLATVKRETAHTFTPIHEYGGRNYFIQRYGGQTRKGRELGNDTPEEGYYYAGKSDVQVTGEANYEKLEIALRREYPREVADWERRTGKVFDLTVGDQPNDTSDPRNILDPVLSYIAMSYGMRTGLYTGRRLSQFVGNGQPNYLGMRTIINGNDHDDEIAADARKFEAILKAALDDDILDLQTLSAAGDPADSTVSQPAAVTSDLVRLDENPPMSPPPSEIIEQAREEAQVEEKAAVGDAAPYTNPQLDPAQASGKENIVIESAPKMTFWDYIKVKFGVLTGGNFTFAAVVGKAQEVQGLGLPATFTFYMILGAAVISFILLVIWFVSWLREENSKEKTTDDLIKANSVEGQYVHFATKEELEAWKAWGAIAVRR